MQVYNCLMIRMSIVNRQVIGVAIIDGEVWYGRGRGGRTNNMEVQWRQGWHATVASAPRCMMAMGWAIAERAT